MKRIRIGKDISIRWEITTDGAAIPLEGRDLLVEIKSPFRVVRNIPFRVDGNTIILTYYGKEQKWVGEYSVTLWENKGKQGQNVVDAIKAFELVKTSPEENDFADGDIQVESIDLGTANLEILSGGAPATPGESPDLSALQMKVDANTTRISEVEANVEENAANIAGAAADASAALTAAQGAQEAASSASENAAQSQELANEAKTTAEEISGKADDALTKATEAFGKADAAEEAAKAMSDELNEFIEENKAKINELDSVLGMYTERASILLEIGTDNQVIDGSTLAPKAKSGWAISKPFGVERGNLYLIKVGQTDSTVVCAAQRITRTWEEADPDTGEFITHTEYSYAKKVQLNTGAELPKDGYLRILGLPSDFDIVISYNKATADRTIKVYRSDTLANICTQIGEQSGKWGVISQTSTWAKDDSGYIMSNQKYGLIPQANIDLFLSAGAEFNDTDSPIEKTAPWGEKVQHLSGYFYLNGLGNISYEEMKDIWNAPRLRVQSNDNVGLYRNATYRTNIAIPIIDKHSGPNTLGDISYLASSYYRQRLEVLKLPTCSTDQPLTVTAVRQALGNGSLQYVIGILDMNNVDTNKYNAIFRVGTRVSRVEEVKLKNINKNFHCDDAKFLSVKSILYMITNSTATTPITITLHANAYDRAMADADIVAALEAKPLVTLASV